MLLTPETAYIYGWRNRESGIDYNQGFIAFMRDIIAAIDKSGLLGKRDKLFYSLCEALGDTRSLITEYLELQSKVNIEQEQIHRFFEFGYSDTGIPSIYEQKPEDKEKKQWQPPKSTTVTKEQMSAALESWSNNGSCPTQG